MTAGLLALATVTYLPAGSLSEAVAASRSVDRLSGTPGEPGERFHFDCGMTVVTCFSNSKANATTDQCFNGMPSDPTGFVVAIFDTTLPKPSSPGIPWLSAQSTGFHNDFGPAPHQFRQKNLGEVFGIALDQQTPENIYVAATSLYPGDGVGPAGFGGVYRIDGSTFNVTPLIALTNVGSVALGNICVDSANQQLLVADLDNGLIRRVALPGGTELPSPFDHGLLATPPVPPSSSMVGDVAAPGRRMFAVQVFGGRLYYSLYSTNLGSSCSRASEIWSVGLNPASSPAGAFVTAGPGGPKLEYRVPNPNCFNAGEVWVTDIAFSPSGKMLIAERGVCTTTPNNLATDAHHSRVMELVQVGGVWTPSGLNPVGAGAPPARNSAGGVDYYCDEATVIMADGLGAPASVGGTPLPAPYQNVYAYGLQINPAGTTGVTNAYLIDLNNNTSSYDKNFLGDVEVYRCCDCLTFSREQVQCTAQTNQFSWSFCYTNTGTLTNKHLVFVDLPSGVTVSPPIIHLPVSIAPGQSFCTNVIVTLNPKAGTNSLCFRIAAHTEKFEECCVVSKCLTIPSCCGFIEKTTVDCDPLTGVPTWTFSLSNQSGSPVQYVVIVPDPPGCVGVPNPVITLPSPLANGSSTTLTVPLSILSTPCTNACFRISLHDKNFVSCCSFTQCISLLCRPDNHPPSVRCPPFTLLCEPKTAIGYVVTASVQDADGDPLTVIWKVNGSPVQTNTVPGGVSLNPTPVSMTHTYPLGVHIITLCVVDSTGTTTLCEFDLEVGDRKPPTLVCPPDRTVVAWEFVIPDLKPETQASDLCTPPRQLVFTQDPPAGTSVGPGVHCVTISVTDSSGQTARCRTCITVSPVALRMPDGTNTFFGVVTKPAPASFTLTAEGALTETASVEYFVDRQSIGTGTGTDFRRTWSGVAPGRYVVSAEATRRGTTRVKAQSQAIHVLVTPRSSDGSAAPGGITSVTLADGVLSLSLATIDGERCSIEVSDSIATPEWREVRKLVGDGTVHVLQFRPEGSSRFIRVRME